MDVAHGPVPSKKGNSFLGGTNFCNLGRGRDVVLSCCTHHRGKRGKPIFSCCTYRSAILGQSHFPSDCHVQVWCFIIDLIVMSTRRPFCALLEHNKLGLTGRAKSHFCACFSNGILSRQMNCGQAVVGQRLPCGSRSNAFL